MTIHEDVHQILIKAGMAQGLTGDEAGILIALSNPYFVQKAKTELKSTLSEIDYKEACTVLDECSQQFRKANLDTKNRIEAKAREIKGETKEERLKILKKEIANKEAALEKLNLLLNQ